MKDRQVLLYQYTEQCFVQITEQNNNFATFFSKLIRTYCHVSAN